VEFVPDIREKAAATRALEMGHAMKVTLQFRSRFWPEENFGFIQSPEDQFPTCWSHERGHLLTLWAGGPRAKQMAGSTEAEIRGAAIGSLTHMFGVQSNFVENELASFMFHDWTSDPFTRGAYSYIPAGSVEAQRSLADPILNTLFFAGEATALDAQLGTVHGALGSGIRAAQQVLRS
jgi:monoamine oxidase